VIEYPTLIFGSIENTKKLHFRVVALHGTEEGALRGVGDNPEGEGERSVGLTQSPSSSSSFPSSSSPNRKRGAGEGDGVNVEEGREGGLGVAKKVRVSDEEVESRIVEREDTHTQSDLLEKDPALEGEEGGGEKEEDDEEEDADAEEVFLSALKEFEGKDIEALKAFIHSSES
jgi:hypothetical protein